MLFGHLLYAELYSALRLKFKQSYELLLQISSLGMFSPAAVYSQLSFLVFRALTFICFFTAG